MLVPVLERVRALCLGLPEATEKVSHGEPAWFAGRMFAMYADHHHDDRVAVWLAAGPGVQEALVADASYFRPPYVGHRGWVGAYLDVPVDEAVLGELVADAYRCVASKRLVALLDAREG
ncbi:MmcQ/YjbR family DNA-binding protein [Actinosynnema sp. NPDC020468]|uniref:MmcQ/YjbR family DNA-binding protein n=1 Tax=Actinosynnema sp. NPDC020468 TaxID=3154488 RepID=UPI0033EED1E4